MSISFTIDPRTACGTVALVVTDLDRSVRYYVDQIGLQLLRREDDIALLGAGDQVLLQLTAQPGARPVQQGRTGLYHFAILTPSRRELSRTLHHLLATNTRLDGASDHGVSEALYLSDPDGHGIEIYRDRPRDQWPLPGGNLQMTLDPLDARGLLAEAPEGAGDWQGLHAGTIIGHVHLHVASIPAAEKFYVDTLGLALMQRFGGQASFVAAGGYHHHLGLNVWAGAGAPPPPADAARLDWYELRLPDAPALQAVVGRLRAAGTAPEQDGARWNVRDPAQNRLVLTT
jgi:catechol 2,3-dioxygenase